MELLFWNTYSKDLLQKGVPIYTVKRWLRHSDAKTMYR